MMKIKRYLECKDDGLDEPHRKKALKSRVTSSGTTTPQRTLPSMTRVPAVDNLQVENVCTPCQLMLQQTWELFRSNDSHINNPAEFEKAALICPMCRIISCVLRGSDDSVLDSKLKYNDDNFNKMGAYYSDGVTDVEEYLVIYRKRQGIKVRGSKVRCEARTVLYSEEVEQPWGLSSLELRLAITYKTRARPRQNEWTTVRLSQSLIVFSDEEHHHGQSLRFTTDPRPSGKEKFEIIASWLKIKEDQPVSMPKAPMPTRLLDVATAGFIRLISADSISPLAEYVALSHRWGTTQHFTLTKATQLQREQIFPDNILPATFLDAVTVTRRLGFAYLWIDALCIIQDDEEDWISESQAMGDYYQNANFVIAAHCAHNDAQGFLADSLRKLPAFPFKPGATPSRTYYLSQKRSLDLDMKESAIGSRAWVLQERFLATRTVHFFAGQMYLETTGFIASEDVSLVKSTRTVPIPLSFGPAAAPELRTLLFQARLPGGIIAGKSETALNTPLEWLDLVEMYQKCHLTREADKLMAIAGLARKLQSQTSKMWWTGIWSDLLCQGLLWLKGNVPLVKPSGERAPSWSWAAHDGPLQYPVSIRERSFCPECRCLSVTSLDSKYQNHQSMSINGPAILKLEAIVLRSAGWHVSRKSEELGPGPTRRGALTEDRWDLPRLGLRQFVRVHAIKSTGGNLPTFGWIAFDDDDDNWAKRSLQERPSDEFDDLAKTSPTFYFALIGTVETSDLDLLYLGIYLTRFTIENQYFYRRLGFGQVAGPVLGATYLDGSEYEHFMRTHASDYESLTMYDVEKRHEYRVISII